jgi:bifunctional non-homologous end joining protein LigD
VTPETTLRAGRRRVRISNPGKVLFPDDGITKEDLARYYAAIAPVMVPHVKDRPLNLWRWNRGIDQELVVQQAIPKGAPEWVRRVTVSRRRGGDVEHAVGGEAATLVWLANQNCITPHVWTARADDLGRPDQVIFDLDPEGDDDFPAVKAGARMLRGILEDLGLAAFVKTTGSKGLHVVSPLRRSADYERVLAFARHVGDLLIEEDPDRFTPEFRKDKRRGRIFVDVLRNRHAQTAVPPYAVRARAGAPVATPIEWDELRSIRNARRYTLQNLFRRLARRGDPWAGMSRRARSLPKL